VVVVENALAGSDSVVRGFRGFLDGDWRNWGSGFLSGDPFTSESRERSKGFERDEGRSKRNSTPDQLAGRAAEEISLLRRLKGTSEKTGDLTARVDRRGCVDSPRIVLQSVGHAPS